MNQTERLYKIQNLLRQGGIVSRSRFLEELEVSYATFQRDLDYLRDRLHAPIDYDPVGGGYRLVSDDQAPRHAMPGMWLNAAEIYALLTIQEIVRQFQPGLLTPFVKPMLERLNQLVGAEPDSSFEIQRRIRIHRINTRTVQPSAFDPVGMALLSRRQIQIDYLGRGRNICESRTVSPLRLTYYRDNWYLDAWCHLRNGLRCFSLDSITSAVASEADALEIPDGEIDAISALGYGIFTGSTLEWATLQFLPERARWISREVWHPLQQAEMQHDGHCVLRLPYSDDRELVMDILRHVPEVAVLGPPALRAKVRAMLERALAMARGPAT